MFKRSTSTKSRSPTQESAVVEKKNLIDNKKFDWNTTALEVLKGVDLKGKIAIVTGANTGIGFETARSLALHGCQVILACRNEENAIEAVEAILKEKRDANVHFMYLALDKLQTVKDFAVEFKKKFKKLNILICNAGVFGIKFAKTVDSYETLFQVNHLSQALLTMLLEEALIKGSPSRVIFLSSEAHRLSHVRAQSLNETTICPRRSSQYWKVAAYCNSKLINIAFASKLGELWSHKEITILSVHPGYFVMTDITRHWWLYKIFFFFVRPFTKTTQQAASTTIFCATSSDPQIKTGQYYNNCYNTKPAKAALDPELADKVWKLTIDLLEQSGFKLSITSV